MRKEGNVSEKDWSTVIIYDRECSFRYENFDEASVSLKERDPKHSTTSAGSLS